ncbi:MAG: hypothetical protein DRI01_09780 [Chloroflexi bacterium]|nr:MAG: hypothetical protein DRI01_09780 [Chloroflexota bacterium]
MTPRKQGRFIFNPASIKEVRDKLHLSQQQLAEKIGVAKTAISRWEKGLITPDANSLALVYSVAQEGRIEPLFFKENESQPKTARSRLVVAWDFQNLPVSWNEVEKIGKAVKDRLVQKFPGTSQSLFKVFSSPTQLLNNSGIRNEGWRIQEYAYNIDEELDTQSWSDCNQAPKDTIFVLITRDGDYAELMEDLREKGVMVYLMAPDDVNQRLAGTVGKKWRMRFPA